MGLLELLSSFLEASNFKYFLKKIKKITAIEMEPNTIK